MSLSDKYNQAVREYSGLNDDCMRAGGVACSVQPILIFWTVQMQTHECHNRTINKSRRYVLV